MDHGYAESGGVIKKRRSDVWNHFEQLGSGKAKCDICSKVVSFIGGTTTNLLRHAKRWHPTIQLSEPQRTSGALVQYLEGVVIEDITDVSVPEEGSTVSHQSLTLQPPALSEHSKRSDVWNCFKKIDPNKVKCDVCSKVISYSGSTTGMLRHIKMVHPAVKLSEEQHASSALVQYMDSTVNDLTDVAVPEETPTLSYHSSLNLQSTAVSQHSRKRSDVWNYYKQISPGRAKCDLCLKVMSFSGKTTTNLLRHVKTRHSNEISNLRTARSLHQGLRKGMSEDLIDVAIPGEITSHQSSFITSTPLAVSQHLSRKYLPAMANHARELLSVEKSNELDEQLVSMIVKDYHPFSIVENKGFKTFINMLNPEYSLPSKKMISSQLIPHLYTKTANIVGEHLQKAVAVTVTTDKWSSINSENFLAVTVHFIDEDCVLKSYLLNCFQYEETCTAENLASELKSLLSDWGVLDKVTVVVTDNAPIITSAIDLCGWQHIPCFAHSIDLVVQAGMQEIKEVERKVRSIVAFFKSYPEALEKLQNLQKEMGLAELKLKQNVATRWNSTYEMFARILKLKEAVLSTLAMVDPELQQLTQMDWEILETSYNILKPFKEVTEEISRGKSVTASKLLLFSRALLRRTALIGHDKDLPKETRVMVQKMLEQLSKQFQDVEENPLLAESMLLDPRFKKQGFQEDEMYREAYKSLSQQASGVLLSDREFEHENTSSVPKSSLLWEDFDTIVSDMPRNSNSTAAGVIELDKYLKEPLLSRMESPLVWWKERKSIYPRLFDVMKSRLCVVVNSVPCERVFSKGGQLLTERRSKLSSGKVSKVMFLSANL